MPPASFLDLNAEQVAYLWRVITNDVEEASAMVRSRAFSQYAQPDAEHVHNNVRIGATLLGLLPVPAPRNPPNQEQ